MQAMEMLGYLGALLTLATFSMKTMLHLRVIGIASNMAFIAYGVVGDVYPVLLLHMVLLPLNIWRLRQLLRLTRQIEDAAASGLSLDWLKPFSCCKSVRAGERLFSTGDAAAEVMVVLSGRFRALEAGVPLEQGEIFGEGWPGFEAPPANANSGMRARRRASSDHLRRGPADVLSESQVRVLLSAIGRGEIDARCEALGQRPGPAKILL